jgi:hypothetical protein
MRSIRPLRALFALALLLAAPSGCRRATDPDPLVGTWLATTFQVTPSGQGMINALTSGGTLGLNIANNFVVTGTLILPPAVTGGAPSTASLAGTAVRTGNSVQFTQSADTFVRNLTFTLVENRLEAANQVVAGTTYDIVLTRQ